MPWSYALLKLFGRQDWIRAAIRQKVIRFFVDPDRPPDSGFTTGLFGLKYRGNLNSYIDWCIYFFGAYEKQELLLLESIMKVKEGGVFIDIGANCGEYSLVLSRAAGRVHSFEPYDKIAAKFKDEIALNGINNITVHEVALGSKGTEMVLYAPLESSNTGTASLLGGHEAKNNRQYKKIQVYNASDYIEKLGLPGVDLIKIDVEGFEKEVLLGLKKVMERYRPVIMMEFSETTRESFSSKEEIAETFKGYEALRISCDRPALFFFNSPAVRLEKFGFDSAPANLLLRPV